MSGIDERLQHSEEALLVLLAQQDDREAFRALVERYDRRLLYFARRIVNDTEESYDVVQAVWLFVHRNLKTLRAPQAFRVWIYRIAHDQSVSTLRRRTRQPIAADESPLGDVPDDGISEAASENAELVHTALGALSIDHRQVLTLRFLEDMSIQEIAEVLSCSAGTIKSRLHYAKTALRRRIEELTND